MTRYSKLPGTKTKRIRKQELKNKVLSANKAQKSIKAKAYNESIKQRYKTKV